MTSLRLNMKARSRAAGSWFFGLVLLLCLSLALPAGAAALSIEEEEELGREFLEEVQKRFELVDDPYLVNYLEDLEDHLSSGVDTQPFPFRFYLIEGADMNAFAAPGGHIFFFTGLVDRLDNLDELAAVATHEMAHITARHVAERIEQGKKIGLATAAGILAGILIGGKAAGALAAGSVAAGTQAQLAFSRADERQADQMGFTYMTASGFEPSAMLSVLNKMQKEEVYGTDKVPAYLRTHPLGPERMANIEGLVSRLETGLEVPEEERLSEDFPVFQTLIRAKYSHADSAKRRFQRMLEKDEDSAMAHLGLGIVANAESDFQSGVRHLEKAHELVPGIQPIIAALAEAYRMCGRNEDAVRLLEKALTRKRNDLDIMYLLAESYQSLGRYREALRLLERIASNEPVRDQVYHSLGVCYGRLDRLGWAHYNFGLYFKKTGEPSKARFHFGKAREHAGNDSRLLEKINEAAGDGGGRADAEEQRPFGLTAAPAVVVGFTE
ncbi:MAG: M48 family metalloprotease [Desulfobacteraceae bacterium]